MPRGSRRPKAGARSSAPSGRAVLTASPPSSNRETLRRNRHEQKRTHYLASHRRAAIGRVGRSEEHTSELQSLMRISYAVFCLKKKKQKTHNINHNKIYTTLSHSQRTREHKAYQTNQVD